MSCFVNNVQETSIEITRSTETEGVVYYDICVQVGTVFWTVRRRFREFVELHDRLVVERSVSKDLLPPKKILGNKNPQFLIERREALQRYLREVLLYLRRTMPSEFVRFLAMDKYDIVFLLHDVARTLFNDGEQLLALQSKSYTFSVLELYAISERIKLPCSSQEMTDGTTNFSHILDFCSQLEKLTIVPRKESASDDHTDTSINDDGQETIVHSNIIPRSLYYNLNVFKCLQTLTVLGTPISNIRDLGSVRETIQTLFVHRASVEQLNQIVLCDDLHKSIHPDASKFWKNVHTANLSRNRIHTVDESVQLIPSLVELNLDSNCLQEISNLHHLSALTHLSLCSNNISICIDWHLELGNIISLNLSHNRIQSLYGFRKMFSLVHLDLAFNLIDDVNEIDHIANLPCLESVRLMGNPVSGTVDYRPRVLSRFDQRLSEVDLDSERGTAEELDKALVFAALRTAQQNLQRGPKPTR